MCIYSHGFDRMPSEIYSVQHVPSLLRVYIYVRGTYNGERRNAKTSLGIRVYMCVCRSLLLSGPHRHQKQDLVFCWDFQRNVLALHVAFWYTLRWRVLHFFGALFFRSGIWDSVFSNRFTCIILGTGIYFFRLSHGQFFLFFMGSYCSFSVIYGFLADGILCHINQISLC